MNLSKDTLRLLHVLHADTAHDCIKGVIFLSPAVWVFVEIADEKSVQPLVAPQLQHTMRSIHFIYTQHKRLQQAPSLLHL